MTKFALILNSPAPSACVKFYSTLGMRFLRERHDGGPEHFAAAHGDFLLEIFHGDPGVPCSLIFVIKADRPDAVDDIASLHSSHVVAGPAYKGGVQRVILRDPDGRKVMVHA